MSTEYDLATLVEERLELLTRLLELTDQQDAAIAAGHMTELMNVLGQKQRYLETMAQQAKLFSKASEQLNGSLPLAAQTRLLQKQCDQLHEQLLAREADSEVQLLQRRDELANQMTQSQTSRSAVARYTQETTQVSSLSAEC